MTSFELRPGFPNDLRVLLIDKDESARASACAVLSSCGYTTTCRDSALDALKEDDISSEYDVVLIDSGCLTADASAAQHCSTILQSSVPVVLMATSCDPSKLLQGVNAGVVDLLEKPLSMSKAATLWTHKVRRLLAAGAGSSPNASNAPPASQPAATAEWQLEQELLGGDQVMDAMDIGGELQADAITAFATCAAGQAVLKHANTDSQGLPPNGSGTGSGGPGAASGGHSGGLGAESGSIASTSEGLRGVMVDLMGSQELDANSFGAAPGLQPLLTRLDSGQVAGLATNLAHLTVVADDLSGLGLTLDALAQAEQQLPTSPHTASHTQPVEHGAHGFRRAQSALTPSATDTGGMDFPPRHRPYHTYHQRQSLQLPQQQRQQQLRHSLDSLATQQHPQQQQQQQAGSGAVRGHAAGRLPDILETQGMVWGIPTSPLHISPKVPSFPQLGQLGAGGLGCMGPGGMGPGLGMMPGMGTGVPGMGAGMPGMGMPGMGMAGMGMGSMGMMPGIPGMGLGMPGMGPGMGAGMPGLGSPLPGMPGMGLGMPGMGAGMPGMGMMPGLGGIGMGPLGMGGSLPPISTTAPGLVPGCNTPMHGMQQLPSGFPISPLGNASNHQLNNLNHQDGFSMGSGMIPTPLPASPAPPPPPTTPATSRARKASGGFNAPPKRAASTPLPQHQMIDQFMAPGIHIMHPHIPPTSAALLDPLSVLDEPMDGFDPLGPLDPLLMDGQGVGALVAAGLCNSNNTTNGNGNGGGADGGCNSGGNMDGVGNGGGVDASDLDDWLLAGPDGPMLSGGGGGGNGGGAGSQSQQQQQQPLGLTLNKSASLADMIMASLDHQEDQGGAGNGAATTTTTSGSKHSNGTMGRGEPEVGQQQQQLFLAGSGDATPVKNSKSKAGSRSSARARKAPAAH